MEVYSAMQIKDARKALDLPQKIGLSSKEYFKRLIKERLLINYTLRRKPLTECMISGW